jgi:hypothetical protein
MATLNEKIIWRTRKGKRGFVRYPIKVLEIVTECGLKLTVKQQPDKRDTRG